MNIDDLHSIITNRRILDKSDVLKRCFTNFSDTDTLKKFMMHEFNNKTYEHGVALSRSDVSFQFIQSWNSDGGPILNGKQITKSIPNYDGAEGQLFVGSLFNGVLSFLDFKNCLFVHVMSDLIDDYMNDMFMPMSFNILDEDFSKTLDSVEKLDIDLAWHFLTIKTDNQSK